MLYSGRYGDLLYFKKITYPNQIREKNTLNNTIKLLLNKKNPVTIQTRTTQIVNNKIPIENPVLTEVLKVIRVQKQLHINFITHNFISFSIFLHIKSVRNLTIICWIEWIK